MSKPVHHYHWPVYLACSPVFCLIVAGALPMGIVRDPETGMHHGAVKEVQG